MTMHAYAVVNCTDEIGTAGHNIPDCIGWGLAIFRDEDTAAKNAANWSAKSGREYRVEQVEIVAASSAPS